MLLDEVDEKDEDVENVLDEYEFIAHCWTNEEYEVKKLTVMEHDDDLGPIDKDK
jgi:hypothetical protein